MVKGRFVVTTATATGTEYGPLQSDGLSYLCPDCGGYGTVPGDKKCEYCQGVGTIALDDPRVNVCPRAQS